VTLTDNTTPHDGSQVEALLDETLTGEADSSKADNGEAEEGPSTVGADGAYDTFDIYDAITDRGATAVVPPQRNAKITKHGNCNGPPRRMRRFGISASTGEKSGSEPRGIIVGASPRRPCTGSRR
jgi:hypothetical protein